MHIFVLHVIIIVEVVNMTNNTQYKTLLNTWLNQKKPMITPSTHASFTLIAENHLIPVSYTHLDVYKRQICSKPIPEQTVWKKKPSPSVLSSAIET